MSWAATRARWNRTPGGLRELLHCPVDRRHLHTGTIETCPEKTILTSDCLGKLPAGSLLMDLVEVEFPEPLVPHISYHQNVVDCYHRPAHGNAHEPPFSLRRHRSFDAKEANRPQNIPSRVARMPQNEIGGSFQPEKRPVMFCGSPLIMFSFKRTRSAAETGFCGHEDGKRPYERTGVSPSRGLVCGSANPG